MNLASLYFSPNGRISRKLYWLASLPLFPLLILVDLLIKAEPSFEATILAAVVGVALLVASFILNIKRCHDRDKSGWFAFIGFIPVLGPLWLLLELGLLRGTEGPNRYGPDPLVAVPHLGAARLATIGFLVTSGAGAGFAYAISDGLIPQEAASEPAVVACDGTVVDLAVPSAAAYRVARHAFAAEAAVWHSLEILEAGIAGALPRDEAVRDASATAILARNEVGATFVAIEAFEENVAGYYSDADLENMTAALQAWAGAAEHVASLTASTVPLITADEVAPGNVTYGLVPTIIQLQKARAQAIEQLSSVIPPASLESVLMQHFVAVSAALGDITELVPAFVDRGGATADLEATAERIWNETLERLSPSHQGVVGLASSFQMHESEIREDIGVPLMEDAFAPVISSYEAAGGELALKPTNALIGLRARLLEAAQLGKRPEAMIVPLLRSAREALIAVAKQAELGETRMGYFLDAVGEAGV